MLLTCVCICVSVNASIYIYVSCFGQSPKTVQLGFKDHLFESHGETVLDSWYAGAAAGLTVEASVTTNIIIPCFYSIAMVSDTSNLLQRDVGNYLGLCIIMALRGARQPCG